MCSKFLLHYFLDVNIMTDIVLLQQAMENLPKELNNLKMNLKKVCKWN